MATLDQSYALANGDNAFTLRFSTVLNVYLAQSFTTVSGGQVEQVKLALNRLGTPTGNIWVEIWSDNAGTPNAQIGSSSANVDVSTLVTTNPPVAYTTFTWSSGYPAISASTKYWIVFNGDYAFSANVNNAQWEGDISSPSYAGGNYARWDGSGLGWTTSTLYDFCFEEYYGSIATFTPKVIMF